MSLVKRMTAVLGASLMMVSFSCAEEEATSADAAGASESSTAGDAAPDGSNADSDSGEADTGDEALAGEMDDGEESEKEDADSMLSAEAALVQLGAQLRQRQRALDLRERELNQREQLIRNLEIASVQQAGELSKLKSELNGIYAKLEQKYEEQRTVTEAKRAERAETYNRAVDELADERRRRITHLVSTIKGMRAETGADLLSSMDDVDAVEVLRKLSARQAASFLGAMPPKKAAKLAQDMLGPRLPPAELFANDGSSAESQGASK